MTRTLTLLALLVALVAPASAQIPVIDAANLVQVKQVVDTVTKVLGVLDDQWDLMMRMSERLQGMDAYRTPPIAGWSHDAALFPHGARFLTAFNVGDARGDIYRQVIPALAAMPAFVDRLAPEARDRLRRAAALVEVADSVGQRGIHNLAQNRGFSAGELARAIAACEEDVTHPRTAYHYLTARFDVLSGCELIARRQDTAANQLLSHNLEQLLVRSLRQREADAETMRLRLSGLQVPAPTSQNDAQALRTWRMP